MFKFIGYETDYKVDRKGKVEGDWLFKKLELGTKFYLVVFGVAKPPLSSTLTVKRCGTSFPRKVRSVLSATFSIPFVSSKIKKPSSLPALIKKVDLSLAPSGSLDLKKKITRNKLVKKKSQQLSKTKWKKTGILKYSYLNWTIGICVRASSITLAPIVLLTSNLIKDIPPFSAQS